MRGSVRRGRRARHGESDDAPLPVCERGRAHGGMTVFHRRLKYVVWFERSLRSFTWHDRTAGQETPAGPSCLLPRVARAAPVRRLALATAAERCAVPCWKEPFHWRRSYPVITHVLNEKEIKSLQGLVHEIASHTHSVESAEFQKESRLYAGELPRELRRAVLDYRSSERSATLVVSGLPVNDSGLGPTPLDRSGSSNDTASLRQDIAFFLIAALLGDPVGWATQQNGRIMHDVYPVKEHEYGQIGWGSAETLTWHTEDAFHPLRADYLGLMCLRNPDGVETTVADIGDVRIDDDLRTLLAQERFFIRPDDAHRLTGHASDTTTGRAAELLRRSRERVERALADPTPVAVLFGDIDDPYLCVDPYYMEDSQGEEEQRALDALGSAIDAALADVVLRPGDICFIDNFRAVHGRKPFRARFDGTDRWLRRLNIARDLRPSRGARLDAETRVIH
ncbi:guanitoxin biosynthesis L-enduracididine beta-hydroxylase GntD [Streptomyces sp. NPDC052042]|uniref:guanitoxin biosynthesis L-enduracididine beta-hydroxylase GntD n=1 Tax=Streptomyces sp. NPDC052042 TaxID=3365683 RepID=UPI0037D02E2C